MPIEAPCSRHRKTNLKIYIGVLITFGVWFGYDGYFNKGFIEKHKSADGKCDSTLVFNQKSPPFFLAGAILLGIYLATVRNKRLVADESELIIAGKVRIPYDSIEKIDKTYFDKKGFFVITYTDKSGKHTNYKISDRKFGNLQAVLEHVVAKIS